MQKLQRLFIYTRPFSKYLGLNILFNALSVLFGLFSIAMVLPFLRLLFKLDVSQAVTTPSQTEGLKNEFYNYLTNLINGYGQHNALLVFCVVVVFVFLLKNLSRYLGMYFLAPVRNGVVANLRNHVYAKVLRLPISYFSNERKGDIMSRMTLDVTEVELSVMSTIEMLTREPLSILLTLGLLFFMSPELTLTAMVLLPLGGLVIGRLSKTLRKSADKGQSQLGGILTVIEETLGGLRIIAGFNAQSRLNERFKGENAAYTRTQNRIYRLRDLASPMSEFLGSVVMMMLIYVGGSLILNKNYNLGPDEFITYIALFSQIIPPAKALTTAWYSLQKGYASLERIDYILNAEESLQSKPNAVEVSTLNDTITYHNVGFAYADTPVLHNINLTIAKGKTIALVGASGAGKSTLADLLPRFYDCTEGSISIDGVDTRDISLPSLRGLIGIVTQETVLFNDTVANNIKLGNPHATQAQVEEAARIANAHEFIAALDGGYNYNIGDRGTKLSGGQRQRLSIARAVLKNPPILILDEATSALDTESEKLVQQALQTLMHSRTSVVIAHRLSTIQTADEIVVLDQGQIAERGTHQSLYTANGIYRKLCDMQAFV